MTDQVSSWVAKRVEPVGIFEEEEEKEDEEEDEDEEEEETGVSFKGDDRH
jgi:hypothetical protein